MEINRVDESADCMDFCTVTWYSCGKEGVNIQRRFPMAARDGRFCGFTPISQYKLRLAKDMMRELDKMLESSHDEKERSLLCARCGECLRSLVGVAPETPRC